MLFLLLQREADVVQSSSSIVVQSSSSIVMFTLRELSDVPCHVFPHCPCPGAVEAGGPIPLRMLPRTGKVISKEHLSTICHFAESNLFHTHFQT